MSAIPDGITLLPASAGTGKTFHIVDRLLRYVVDEEQDLQRVVVVTFTEAAAAELKDRIRGRLVWARKGLLHPSGWPDAPDDTLQTWVQGHRDRGTHQAAATRIWDTLTSFDTCCITTIHGFCSRVLTEAAFEAGAAFATELLTDTDPLFQAVADDFWVRHTWDASPKTLRSLRALHLTRKELFKLAKLAADPDLHIEPGPPDRPEPTDLTDLTAWRAGIQEVADQASDGTAEDLLATSEDLKRRRAKKGVGNALGKRRVESHFEDLSVWVNSEPLPEQSAPDWLLELTPGWLAEATKRDKTPPTHPLFDAVQALHDLRASLLPIRHTWKLHLQYEIIEDVRRRLPSFLRRRNALTFDEMLRRVSAPLHCPRQGPLLREAVRCRYDAAIVDEFQDTSPNQWHIFHQIFGDKLFLVGDPKQAIYSFRGADFNTYKHAETQCKQARSLDTNFRSDTLLVQAVHTLFARPGMMQPFFDPRIPYPAVQAANQLPGIEGDTRAPLQILLLSRTRERATQNGFLKHALLNSRLPGIVAHDIVEELNRKGVLRSTGVPVGPGDCAVLTRTNQQAQAVATALVRRGVPAVVRSDKSVFDTQQYQDLRLLLRAIHDPLNTHRVRRALMTDLLGTSAADLERMPRDQPLWAQTAGRFRAWRICWDERGILGLIRTVLDDAGIAERLLEQGDERGVTHLLHLAEIFQRVQVERRLTPTGFLGWMDEGHPGVDPEDAQVRLETDAEAVQCVTVHSAKGLEYPLVWAPYLHAKIRDPEVDLLMVTDATNPGKRCLDLRAPREKSSRIEQSTHDAMAEELRLIYVALTRARHRLVLYYGVTGKDAPLGWLIHQNSTQPTDLAGRREAIRLRRRLNRSTKAEDHLPPDLTALAQSGPLAWDLVDWSTSWSALSWSPKSASKPAACTQTLCRPTPPDRAWRRTSFTALTREVSPLEPHPERDHDTDQDTRAAASELPLADVRGSARFGIAVHSVLEHHDFQAAPETLEPRVHQTLSQLGLETGWTDAVTQQLARVLQTPLLEGFCLADLRRTARWDELDFLLPMPDRTPRFSPETLATAFQGPLGPGLDERWRDHLQRLCFLPLHGFLVGSIDLVFRHQGRWYLADYKTNTLGPERADYAPKALVPAMLHAHYPLQYHLYTVGLVRLLRARIPGFDYERDFGGALYLFIRGMDPKHPGDGVFFDRPPAELVQRIDHALGTP